ncbi:MAG: hypothetical protein GY856_52845, partial [bacterium]|nr:hypothetical protein [bacterium]
TDDIAAITSTTVFDLDGDGSREVLYLDNETFYIPGGTTGELLHSQPNTSKTGSEYPVVADVDGDGRAEILLPSNAGFNGDLSTQGLHVLGHPSWQGTRPIWNEYSCHVTNVQLDGTVPIGEAPSWQEESTASNSYRVNQQLPPPVPYLPNLTISMPRVGAATTEGIPVTLRIGNGGREAIGAGVVLALYAGTPDDVDPTSSVADVETVTSRGLRAGEWYDLTVHWQAITYQGTPVAAVIDPGAAVDECDEADNAVGFVLDETLLPDLTLPPEGLTAPASAGAGALVPISAQVRNDGTAVATTSVLRLYLGNPGTAAAEVEVPPVAPDEVVEVELLWDTRDLASGSYTLEARA